MKQYDSQIINFVKDNDVPIYNECCVTLFEEGREREEKQMFSGNLEWFEQQNKEK